MTLDEFLSLPDVVAKRFADDLGIPAPLLSQYRYPERDNGRQIPEDRCPDIERKSGGRVTCEESRPDISWVRITDKKWPHPKGRPLVDHSHKKAA